MGGAGHGSCVTWLGVGCQVGSQIGWEKVGCFAEGFITSLIDFGPNSPPGASDGMRTVRDGLEVATPRLVKILRKGAAGSKVADGVLYLGEVLIAGQVGLAIWDGVEAVHNCK